MSAEPGPQSDPGFTKGEHRKLRDLVGTAHERELASALRDLHKRFAEFDRGAIDAFELKDDVHKFHDGPARESGNSLQAGLWLAGAPVEYCY